MNTAWNAMAIKLPSTDTRRPRDLVGLSPDTHSGVTDVLKPFPHPLTAMLMDRLGTVMVLREPNDAADYHLCCAVRSCL